MNETMYTLVPSTNRGRYALDDPEGQDITSGDSMAIWFSGQWIEGSGVHAGKLYTSESSGRSEGGDYFIVSTGGLKGIDSQADCCQYFYVTEYGTANGRHHLDTVHYMPKLPT